MTDPIPVEQDNPRESDAPFREALARVINMYSAENGSDTPDFVLAGYLLATLAVFNATVREQDQWYGHEGLTARLGQPAEAARDLTTFIVWARVREPDSSHVLDGKEYFLVEAATEREALDRFTRYTVDKGDGYAERVTWVGAARPERIA